MVLVDIPVTYVPHPLGVSAANFAYYRPDDSIPIVEGSRDLTFMGELINRGSVRVEDIGVRITLVDKPGAVLAIYNDIIFVAPTALSPGEMTVWQIGTTETVGTAAVQIEVYTDPKYNRRNLTSAGLEVRGITTKPSGNGWLSVQGSIHNIASTPTTRSSGAMLALYDAQGRLVRVADCSSGGASTQSGQVTTCRLSPFKPYGPASSIRIFPFTTR